MAYVRESNSGAALADDAERPDERALVLTPSQTAGPYLSIGTGWCSEATLVPDAASGFVPIAGRVFDGTGAPVTDAVLEFWQADAEGLFPPGSHPGWSGFTRALTDGEGAWRLLTVKPGRVAAGDGRLQAPHIDVSIFARGLQQRLVTRIYFGDEETANAGDPVLGSLEPTSAATLVAEVGLAGYYIDIHLQGDAETVFFVP